MMPAPKRGASGGASPAQVPTDESQQLATEPDAAAKCVFPGFKMAARMDPDTAANYGSYVQSIRLMCKDMIERRRRG